MKRISIALLSIFLFASAVQAEEKDKKYISMEDNAQLGMKISSPTVIFILNAGGGGGGSPGKLAYHNFFFRDAADIITGILNNYRLDNTSVTLQGNNFNISSNAAAIALILSSSNSLWMPLNGSTPTKTGGAVFGGSVTAAAYNSISGLYDGFSVSSNSSEVNKLKLSSDTLDEVYVPQSSSGTTFLLLDGGAATKSGKLTINGILKAASELTVTGQTTIIGTTTIRGTGGLAVNDGISGSIYLGPNGARLLTGADSNATVVRIDKGGKGSAGDGGLTTFAEDLHINGKSGALKTKVYGTGLEVQAELNQYFAATFQSSATFLSSLTASSATVTTTMTANTVNASSFVLRDIAYNPPPTQGTAGQLLGTNGAGQLLWYTDATGGGSSGGASTSTRVLQGGGDAIVSTPVATWIGRWRTGASTPIVTSAQAFWTNHNNATVPVTMNLVKWGAGVWSGVYVSSFVITERSTFSAVSKVETELAAYSDYGIIITTAPKPSENSPGGPMGMSFDWYSKP